MIVTPNGTYVSSIQILHLAGPVVAGTALVYLKSATQPAAAEFVNPYTVASETSAQTGGVATVTGANTWNLGQVWNITFNQFHMPAAGGNITVYVVAGSQLLFSVILPGAITATPPTIVSTATAPATPAVGVPFTVYATLAGSYTPYSVYINLAAMPGGPSTSKLMTQNSQGQWTYTVSAGATAAGTFYGFVNASSSAANGGQQATGAVVITIAATGTSNGPLSVGVILVPSPANPGTAESVQAVVTYTGPVLSVAKSVTVSFSATSSPTGYTFSGTGPSGVMISGPGGPASVTVTSQSTWTIPGPNTVYSYTVSATATVATVGSITGNTLVHAGPACPLADQRSRRQYGHRHGFGVLDRVGFDRNAVVRRGRDHTIRLQLRHVVGSGHHSRQRRRICLYLHRAQRRSGGLGDGGRHRCSLRTERLLLPVHGDRLDDLALGTDERDRGQ